MDIVVHVCGQKRHEAQLNSIQPWTQQHLGNSREKEMRTFFPTHLVWLQVKR